MRRINIVFFIFFLHASCEHTVNEGIFYPDPFKDAFKGRGIRMMASYAPDMPFLIDSVYFNQKGEIIEKREFKTIKRYEYNEFGFLVRLLALDDVPSNYYFRYKREGKDLLQQWYLIKHLRWDFDENNDLEKIERVVRFVLDDSKRIIKEVDKNSGRITDYKYNAKGKLVEKVVTSNENGNLGILRWLYEYGDTNNLEKIEYFKDTTLLIEHYYNSDGLLETSQEDSYTMLYRYEHY